MASKPSLPRAADAADVDVDPPDQTLEAPSKVPRQAQPKEAAQGLCNIFVMWNYPSGPPLQRSRTLDLFCKLQGISSQVCMLMSLRAQVHFEELGVMAALLAWTLPLPVDDQRYEYPSALSSNPIRTHGAAFDVKRYRFCRHLFQICQQSLSACHTTPPSLTLSGAAHAMGNLQQGGQAFVPGCYSHPPCEGTHCCIIMVGCIWILTTAQFVIQTPGGLDLLSASASLQLCWTPDNLRIFL